MATSKEIDFTLASLAVAYPYYDKQQANPDLARQIFHRILSDVDGKLLEAATMQWLSTANKYHPTPGELRDLALTLVERGNGDNPDAAWAEVLDALQHKGSYWTPVWSSAAIEDTMKSFGRWTDFCMTETDQIGIVRAQFLRIYEAQAKRRHDDRLMLPDVRDTVQARIAQLAERKALTQGEQ